MRLLRPDVLVALLVVVLVALASPASATNKAQASKAGSVTSGTWDLSLSRQTTTAPDTAVEIGEGDLLGLSQGVPVYAVHSGTVPLRASSRPTISVTVSGVSGLMVQSTVYACNGTWTAMLTCSGTLASVASSTAPGVLPAWAVPAPGTRRQLAVKSTSLMSMGMIRLDMATTY